ncbi:ribose ABC transporter substrate-binding protein [bacterium]|nr:MAG: ribose ABC transporter substrate-binding protein [bacterium]
MGNAAETPGTAPTAGVSGKKLRIGVSIPAADHGWTAGVNWWAKRAMDLHPEVEWTFAAAADPNKQIADIETMIAKGVDGLVVLATESAPLTPVAEQAHGKGIFLVNVDRGFLKPVADVFIEGDNEAFGRKSGEYMVQKLGGKGDIVVLEGIPSTVNTARVEAFKAALKAAPGIRILDSQSGMWNPQKAQDVMQTLLVKHPKIDAVWASDDDMLLGAERSMKAANRTGIWMLGGAGMKDVIKRVMDGDPTVPADVTYPPSMIAQGIHTAVTALQGGKLAQVKEFLPRHMKIDVELVTAENAKDHYFPDSVY